MRQRDDAALLVDIIVSAEEAVELTSSSALDSFLTDRTLQLATVKLLEVIGEAAGRLSPELTAANQDIPWRRVIGMRHRLVHGYDSIDYRIVWSVVRNELPQLSAQLRTLAPAESDGPD